MKVLPNQDLLDIVLQGCGTMEAGMQVAADNDMPISSLLNVGDDIVISADAAGKGDRGVLKYLQQNSIVIGTLGGTEPGGVLSSEDGEDILVSEEGDSVLIPEN